MTINMTAGNIYPSISTIGTYYRTSKVMTAKNIGLTNIYVGRAVVLAADSLTEVQALDALDTADSTLNSLVVAVVGASANSSYMQIDSTTGLGYYAPGSYVTYIYDGVFFTDAVENYQDRAYALALTANGGQFGSSSVAPATTGTTNPARLKLGEVIFANEMAQFDTGATNLATTIARVEIRQPLINGV